MTLRPDHAIARFQRQSTGGVVQGGHGHTTYFFGGGHEQMVGAGGVPTSARPGEGDDGQQEARGRVPLLGGQL